MKIEGATITFSSGRERDVIGGIIGLDPGLDFVSAGSDGAVWSEYERDDDYMDEEERLTSVDLSELADYMIEQWTLFKAKQGT